MTLWEKIVLDELHSLKRWRMAVDLQIPAEITTCRQTLKELSGLKAANLDKMPAGQESQEDRILDCIVKIDFLKMREKNCRRQVKDLERKLDKLEPVERAVIEGMIIDGKKAGTLAEEMGYNERTIYNFRSDALRHIAQMSGAE